MKLCLVTALALTSFTAPLTAEQQSPLSAISNETPESIIDASPFLSLHRGLVSIPSISGNESAVGDFLASFLQSHNFNVVKQPVPGRTSRFNVFAYPASSAPNPSILLTSHIDTVPPFIPYSVHKNDSENSNGDGEIIVTGRGSDDAKGSVAAQVFAALETLESNPSAPLALLFVVDEEVGGAGMRAFSSNTTLNPPPGSPSDLIGEGFKTVIFGEPTELALVSGHKGMLSFHVHVTGKSSHSGYPWLGESALSTILPALTVIDKLGDTPVEQGGLPASDKYGRTTVNIGRVEAGVAANVVPSTADADVAVRLAAGTPEDAMEIILRAVANATDNNPNVEVEFSQGPNGGVGGYAPQDLDVDVDGFDVITVNYGTDVPNLKIYEGADVKRYLYGPGSIFVAHGDHEGITVAQLEEAVRGYKRLIDAALGRL
ncbi:M20 family metallopeptidase [Aspergillus undulatus]|uniref:M20 family metallopeptidase n=1 Tax=Aspergillus undulatus TaxID=1810928 RepID=UPI003CCD206C